jgi:hypothetical protein
MIRSIRSHRAGRGSNMGRTGGRPTVRDSHVIDLAFGHRVCALESVSRPEPEMREGHPVSLDRVAPTMIPCGGLFSFPSRCGWRPHLSRRYADLPRLVFAPKGEVLDSNAPTNTACVRVVQLHLTSQGHEAHDGSRLANLASRLHRSVDVRLHGQELGDQSELDATSCAPAHTYYCQSYPVGCAGARRTCLLSQQDPSS